MTARSIPFTEAILAKWLKERRGKGTGPNYLPWIRRDEILSVGTRFLASCGRCGREAHLFSTTEHKGFLFYDSRRWVKALLEQFPLDRDETLDIAKELGIQHPMDTNTRVPIVMTTDLVVDGADRNGVPVMLARSGKPKYQLEEFNHIEHGEIERRYWKRRGRVWKFLTEDAVTDDMYANLELMRPNRFLNLETEPYVGCLEEMCCIVIEALLRERISLTLDKFAQKIQPALNSRYSANQVLLYLIYHGRVAASIADGSFMCQDSLAIAARTKSLVEALRRSA